MVDLAIIGYELKTIKHASFLPHSHFQLPSQKTCSCLGPASFMIPTYSLPICLFGNMNSKFLIFLVHNNAKSKVSSAWSYLDAFVVSKKDPLLT